MLAVPNFQSFHKGQGRNGVLRKTAQKIVKLSPFMASIRRGSIWIQVGPSAVSTSQIINSCTWGLKLLSAPLTTPWNRSLLYYSQPIFSKETILTSYLLQMCLIRPGEVGIRGLQTLPAKVIRDSENVNSSQDKRVYIFMGRTVRI